MSLKRMDANGTWNYVHVLVSEEKIRNISCVGEFTSLLKNYVGLFFFPPFFSGKESKINKEFILTKLYKHLSNGYNS